MKIKFMLLPVLLVSLFIVLPANGGDTYNVMLRSGTVENDEIEEPLSSGALEFRMYLENSNRVLDLLIAGNYQAVYNDYFSDRLKNEISYDNFIKITGMLRDKAGVMKSYMPMQWYFILHEENGVKYVASIKLVTCEAAVVYYQFVYGEGNPAKIEGFHVRPKRSIEINSSPVL